MIRLALIQRGRIFRPTFPYSGRVLRINDYFSLPLRVLPLLQRANYHDDGVFGYRIPRKFVMPDCKSITDLDGNTISPLVIDHSLRRYLPTID